MYKSYKEDCQDLKQKYPDLAAQFSQWSFLQDALRWADGQDSNVGTMDFLQQDEFSHDVVLHYHPTDEYIVFGVT